MSIEGLRLPVHVDWPASDLLLLVDVFAADSGCELVVVSGNDHDHSINSTHYEDRALDIQGSFTCLDTLNSWFLRWPEIFTYWQVAGHWEHVHVEWRE